MSDYDLDATKGYPFAAIVGQEPLKLALLLNAIDPTIGGVLISGERGTAKSTAARGLAELLPPLLVRRGCPYNTAPDDSQPLTTAQNCSEVTTDSHRITVPFVELPLGATEDRVVGTLDLERALRDRDKAFQPGLLAAANRGILYIDEVNLLADHLVDLLLDAAASGTNVVQREGLQVVHPARFMLVGSMNPEEGPLRPQLLDRFGLMVSVAAPRDPLLRIEVVRRRRDFEQNPAAFRQAWYADQMRLRDSIAAARQRLPNVRITDELLARACHLCAEMEVDGLRADIALHKAACAIAALEERDQVSVDDIRRAAELVLPHRRRRKPLEKPGLDQEQLEHLLQPPEGSGADDDCDGDPRNEPGGGKDRTLPGSLPDGDSNNHPHDPQANGAATTFAPRPIETPSSIGIVARPQALHSSGQRLANSHVTSGRFLRAIPDASPKPLAVKETIQSAALRQTNHEVPLQIAASDLHRKVLQGEAGTLVVFVVDASGSMAARRRMEAVKGAVLNLLDDAYRQRDRVAVISFRGAAAEISLPPTKSLELARQVLEHLPTGGRTPLAHALKLSIDLLHHEQQTCPDATVLLVLLTDGKNNVGLADTPGDVRQHVQQMASELAQLPVASLVIDTDEDFVRLGLAREVASTLQAEYRLLNNLSVESLTLEVRQRCRPSSAGNMGARNMNARKGNGR
jgi:magnesium chelatase subunit D